MSDLRPDPPESNHFKMCRFTRQHLMITLLIEGALAITGIVMMVAGFRQTGEQTYCCLLTAVCLLLLQNAVVLTAILALLGSRTSRVD